MCLSVGGMRGHAPIPVLRARVSVSMNVSMTLRARRFRYGLLPVTWTWNSGVHMTWRNVLEGQHGLWERHKNLDREKPLNARSRYLHIDRHAKHSVRSKPVRALASCSVTAQRLCAVEQGS